jgi:hypothetical protein
MVKIMQKDNDVISYGYVYKVTYPNGKIYVGRDTGWCAEFDYYRYVGTQSLRAKEKIRRDIDEITGSDKKITITKELLYEAKLCTVGHIKKKEIEFIRLLDATNESVGYNLR